MDALNKSDIPGSFRHVLPLVKIILLWTGIIIGLIIAEIYVWTVYGHMRSAGNIAPANGSGVIFYSQWVLIALMTACYLATAICATVNTDKGVSRREIEPVGYALLVMTPMCLTAWGVALGTGKVFQFYYASGLGSTAGSVV